MSATGSARAPSDRGFTLLEMLVVLAVMALIAGISFPAVERLSVRSGLLAARNMVMAELLTARADAFRTDSATSISVAPDGRSLAQADGVPIQIPQGVALAAQPARLHFYPDGSTSGGQLQLRSDVLATDIVVDTEQGRLAASPIRQVARG